MILRIIRSTSFSLQSSLCSLPEHIILKRLVFLTHPNCFKNYIWISKMKFLFLLFIGLTLTTALPQRGIYKKYTLRKTPRQGDAVNGTTTVVPVTTVSTTTTTTDASIEEAQTEGVSEQDASSSAPPITTTEELNKPFAEPTKTPARPVDTVDPEVVQPQQPVQVPQSQNQTKTEEEDDSSSEEDDETSSETDGDTDADADPEAESGRQMKMKVTKLEVASVRPTIKKTRETKPVRGPKYQGVVRGYLSETGEILVPISAFPQNFRYSIVHDKAELNAEDVVPVSSEEAGGPDNHEEVETQSEEAVPIKVQQKGPVNDTEVAGVSEEARPDSASAEEPEDKVVSESTEKPAAEKAPQAPPKSVFNPPPLAALPATKPTDEDDEEEAGGRRGVHFSGVPEPGYYVNPYNFNPYYYEDYDF